MWRESMEAPAVADRMLRRNSAIVAECGTELRQRPPSMVLSIARGSSGCVATYARYLIETRLGVRTAPALMSVHSLYRSPYQAAGVLALSISQSGRSPDLLASAGALRAAAASVYAITNDEESPLAELSNRVIPLHAGVESGIAATKTWIASMTAVLHLVAEWRQDCDLRRTLSDIGTQLERASRLDWAEAVEALLHLDSVLVIGRGVGLATAQEVALKLAETCGIRALAYSGAEFLHGPISLIAPGTVVLILSQEDATRSSLAQLAAALVARHARVLQVGLSTVGTVRLPSLRADAVAEPLLMAQSAYGMLACLSVARGRDPDAPPGIQKISYST